MNSFCIIEGISSVSAVINNTLKSLSNSPRRITDLYIDASKLKKFDRSFYARYKFLKESSQLCGCSFIEMEPTELNKIISGTTHGGIAAKCECPEIEKLTEDSVVENAFYCYLDGIDDPFNLGYIIRTLYPFGCCGIILPENNKLVGAPSTVIKSSAGITESVNIYTSSPEDFCRIMHARSYKIACASIRESIPCCDADLTSPIALVIGGEKRGISSKILECSNLNVRIEYAVPYNGSLPAVCAASVLAYEVGRQLNKV